MSYGEVRHCGLVVSSILLGSMETGTGLVRALAAVMEAGADVINMSYGEVRHCAYEFIWRAHWWFESRPPLWFPLLLEKRV
jgi:hypothetical protein